VIQAAPSFFSRIMWSYFMKLSSLRLLIGRQTGMAWPTIGISQNCTGWHAWLSNLGCEGRALRHGFAAERQFPGEYDRISSGGPLAQGKST
jgi:hypothetical protein